MLLIRGVSLVFTIKTKIPKMISNRTCHIIYRSKTVTLSIEAVILNSSTRQIMQVVVYFLQQNFFTDVNISDITLISHHTNNTLNSKTREITNPS